MIFRQDRGPIIAENSGMTLHKLNGTSGTGISGSAQGYRHTWPGRGILLYLDEIQYLNKAAAKLAGVH